MSKNNNKKKHKVPRQSYTANLDCENLDTLKSNSQNKHL